MRCSDATSDRCWPFFLISNSSCISQSDQWCIRFAGLPAARSYGTPSEFKFFWGITFRIPSRSWKISSVSARLRATQFPRSCSSILSVRAFKLSTQFPIISSSVWFLVLSLIGFCMSNREQSSPDHYSSSPLRYYLLEHQAVNIWQKPSESTSTRCIQGKSFTLKHSAFIYIHTADPLNKFEI